MPRNPYKTPCSIPGCHAWAIRGSDPPLCSPHRHLKPPNPPPTPSESRFTPPDSRFTFHASRPTPHDSPPASPPPRVGAPPGNQNRLVHGFYASALHPDENADLLAHAGDTSLDAEIAITRVALRRILAMLLTGHTLGPNPTPLTAWDYGRFAGLAFQGAGTISRLLRAREALTGGWSAEFEEAINAALDHLSEEWGVEL